MSNQLGNHGPQAQTSEMLPPSTNTAITVYFLKQGIHFVTGIGIGLIADQGSLRLLGHRATEGLQANRVKTAACFSRVDQNFATVLFHCMECQ